MFSIDKKVHNWTTEAKRLAHSAYRPRSGSYNVVRRSHPNQTPRRKDCREFRFKGAQFGDRTSMVLEHARLKYRELGISQKSTWFMLHRLREATERGNMIFSSLIEVDETYVGRKRKIKRDAQPRGIKATSGGGVGKAAVVGVNNQYCSQDLAEVADNTDNTTLRNFAVRHVKGEAKVHTDKATAHMVLPLVGLKAVRHGQSKREMGTIEQMSCTITCTQDKRLNYTELAK